MRRAKKTAMLILASGALLAAPVAAQQFETVPQAEPQQQAGEPISGKVAVLNIQFAMANTQEGKKAREDLEERFNPLQAELEKLRREIQDLQNQLQTQERTLSDEARRELVRELEDKRKRSNRMEEDLRDEVQDAQTEYVNRIGEKMQRVIERYARENNLRMILNAFQGGPILWRDRAVDITADIIALYDQMYPQPAAGASQPGGSSPPPQSNPRR